MQPGNTTLNPASLGEKPEEYFPGDLQEKARPLPGEEAGQRPKKSERWIAWNEKHGSVI